MIRRGLVHRLGHHASASGLRSRVAVWVRVSSSSGPPPVSLTLIFLSSKYPPSKLSEWDSILCALRTAYVCGENFRTKRWSNNFWHVHLGAGERRICETRKMQTVVRWQYSKTGQKGKEPDDCREEEGSLLRSTRYRECIVPKVNKML
jgi:hypothetical protein